MAVYVNKNKWRGVKIGGKTVTKIYKDGEKIYDNSAPLTNPVVGDAIMNLSGANNAIIDVPASGWYRLQIASSRGQQMNSGNGGHGAVISYDLYLEQGWKILGWGCYAYICGSPTKIKGGTGQSNYTGNLPGDFANLLGGGGRNGLSYNDCGCGGGGAAGNGGTGANAWGQGGYGGAGSGIIVYRGDIYKAFYQTANGDNSVVYWARLPITVGDPVYGGDFKYNYDANGLPTPDNIQPDKYGQVIRDYNADTNTLTVGFATGILTVQFDALSSFDLYPYASPDYWQYLVLCGGGGGSAGDNGEPRNDGAAGGAGSRGGGNRQGNGGGGGYDGLAGLQYGTNTSFDSRWGGQNPPGAGNVLDVRDRNNPKVLSNRTGGRNDFTGYARVYPLT